MKNLFLLSIGVLFLLVSCNNSIETPKDQADVTETTVVTETVSEEVKSSDNSIDGLLDEYESICGEYAKFIESADVTSTDYAEKFQELSGRMTTFTEKITSSIHDFTPEQVTRYTEISTKLSEATMK